MPPFFTIVLVLVVAQSFKHSVPFRFSIGLGIAGWGYSLFVQKVFLPN